MGGIGFVDSDKEICVIKVRGMDGIVCNRIRPLFCACMWEYLLFLLLIATGLGRRVAAETHRAWLWTRTLPTGTTNRV